MNHWSFDHGFQGWIKAGDSGEIFPRTFRPNNPNQKINTEILRSFSNPQHVRHLKHCKKTTWTLLKTRCWPQTPQNANEINAGKKEPIRSSGWRSTDQSFRPQSDDPQANNAAKGWKISKFGIHQKNGAITHELLNFSNMWRWQRWAPTSYKLSYNPL